MLPQAWRVLLGFTLGMVTILPARAVSATETELSEARRWVVAKFEGKVEPRPAEPYLEVEAKRGSLQENGRDSEPLRIFGKAYKRGLYMDGLHAVTVHLPMAAKTFEATVGLDGSYSGCGSTSGSQRFWVEAEGKKLFESGIVKVATPGVPVQVDLGGATEFTLRDAEGKPEGEKLSWCDEAVWAEARVTLASGKSWWLGDLPIAPLPGPFTTELPFSFTYGGRSSGEFLATWETKRKVRNLDGQRTEYATTYTDPRTHLVVRWEAVAYHDYPTVEWTLWLENAGSADTPLLENIQALDTRLERTGGNEFILHHFKGSLTTPTDYEPYETTLGAKQEKRIATSGGRPTNGALCYFNLEWQREGVIIALGWPGQWAAQFTRDEGRGLQVQAGQELTHFKLHPGEKVRTPLVALQFWKGDWIGAQNIWRRWMLAHNVPRSGGTPLGPSTWGESADWTGYTGVDEANQEFSIARYLEEGIKIDYWEMDAGWYVNNGTWVNTGTWEPDPKRFPHGLRPLFDYAHARGLKTHIWFELERVTRGTWLWEKHPEWLLKCPEGERDGRRLLNLGDPRAYQWVIEILDKYITEGIDFYRTDFNIDPLPYWRAHDAPDRQGITEIRYVTAFLAYFDELLRRHPNILLDTCASGGSRNDLETLRRAVPITRSDYNSEPVGGQNITYGIALWIPCYGSGTLTADPYFIRSTWSPRYGFGWDMRRKDFDYDFLRDVLREWRSVADYYFGDFYPLTPYHATNGVWMAWQFDRPDRGEGMVQAFRRTDSPLESARFQLRGLEPDARYALTDLDVPGSREMTGRELMDEGLPVLIKVQPAAAVITYKRVEAVQK